MADPVVQGMASLGSAWRGFWLGGSPSGGPPASYALVSAHGSPDGHDFGLQPVAVPVCGPRAAPSIFGTRKTRVLHLTTTSADAFTATTASSSNDRFHDPACAR